MWSRMNNTSHDIENRDSTSWWTTSVFWLQVFFYSFTAASYALVCARAERLGLSRGHSDKKAACLYPCAWRLLCIVYCLVILFVLEDIYDGALAAFHNAPAVLTIHVCSICGEIALAVGLFLPSLCRRDVGCGGERSGGGGGETSGGDGSDSGGDGSDSGGDGSGGGGRLSLSSDSSSTSWFNFFDWLNFFD